MSVTERGVMRAVLMEEFVQSLDEVKTSTISIPAAPRNPAQTHYRVKVTHVSPTHVDTLYARGLHQNNNRERGFVHPPFVLGMEFSGIVVEVYAATDSSSSEDGLSKFSKGDRVWGAHLGAFAEFVVCPYSALRSLPLRLSLRDAAALGTSTAPVSYGALMRVARLKKGETCLVHAAAGGLGVVAVQIALAVGAKVIGTVGSDAKVKVVEKLIKRSSSLEQEIQRGSGVVCYDQPGWEEAVKRLTGGRGVDVVFDTVGLVEKSIQVCAFNARIVVIGFVGRDGQMEKVAMNRILLKQIQVLGYRFGETGRRMPGETIETWTGLDRMLDRGDVQPVVYRDFVGLDSISEVLNLMTTREVAGKIVIAVEDVGQKDDAHGRSGARL